MKREFNVRVVQDTETGQFTFLPSCFMHRIAKKGQNSEWVDASARDREKFQRQLHPAGHPDKRADALALVICQRRVIG